MSKTTEIIFKVYKTQTKLQGYYAMQCLATLRVRSVAVLQEISWWKFVSIRNHGITRDCYTGGNRGSQEKIEKDSRNAISNPFLFSDVFNNFLWNHDSQTISFIDVVDDIVNYFSVVWIFSLIVARKDSSFNSCSCRSLCSFFLFRILLMRKRATRLMTTKI